VAERERICGRCVDLTGLVLGPDVINCERARTRIDRDVTALCIHLGVVARDMKRVPIPAQCRLSGRQPVRKLECKGLRVMLDAVRDIGDLEPFHLLALRVGVVRDVEGTITNVGRGIDVLDIHGAPSGDHGAAVSWLRVAAREVVTADTATDGVVLVRAMADARQRL